MVKKIIILLKDFLVRFSVRVDERGRKILVAEEIKLRKKEKYER